MITITVNNRQLFIPADTVLVLEQRNNGFDIDNIGSDIVWTFDLPAAPNAIALDNAHHVAVSNFKRYRCQVAFSGAPIATGNLYVQSVTDEQRISCGIVLDGLGEEFGSRMLKDDDYPDDIVLSQPTDPLEEHRSHWLDFLRSSLDPESVYKFFLFTSEKFYSDNDAYGYHQNQHAALGGVTTDEKKWTAYVNRLLLWRPSSDPYASPSMPTGNKATQLLFNTTSNNDDKTNGYAFAPAIRLDWLVRQVFANAGYTVTGDFLTNKHIKRLYLQSLNAMDGDLSQFGENMYFYVENAQGDNPARTAYSIDVGVNERAFSGFKLQGVPTFNFALDFDIPKNKVDITPTTQKPWTVEESVAMLLIRTADMAAAGKYPCARAVVDSSATYRDFVYGLSSVWTQTAEIITIVTEDGNKMKWTGYSSSGRWQEAEIVSKSDGLYCIQLTPSVGNPNISYRDPDDEYDILGKFKANQLFVQGDRSASWVVELAIFKVRSVEHGAWDNDLKSINHTIHLPFGDTNTAGFDHNIQVQKYGQVEELEFMESIPLPSLSQVNTQLNVFDTALRWHQHVPNVTNADFIKNICRFFGLSLYVNPFLKEVQLSFVNNVFEASALDITPYIVGTERMTYEPRQYHVGVDTVLDKKGVAEEMMLSDAASRSDLPLPRSRKRRSAFVRNENAYNHSVYDEDSGQYVWETSAGDDRQLVTGDEGDTVEELTTGISIPNMRVVDTNRRLCDIPITGNSKLLDDDYTGEFDMILQQYKGLRFAGIGTTIQTGIMSAARNVGFCETADPTSLNNDGEQDEDFIDLAASGERSVGELWLRRYYQFMAQHETYRFTARLPLSMFLQVYSLQQPQHTAVCDEKRWLLIKNRRYIPLTVTYELGQSDTVLATIECARAHVG